MKTIFTFVVLALLSASCATDRGWVLAGTSVQPEAGGPVTFQPQLPVDIGREPRPLSNLNVPKFSGPAQADSGE